MENNRGQWGSNFGFLMAAVGSAVGLGNIWGFPYKMGRSGGFTFIIIYLLLLLTAKVNVWKILPMGLLGQAAIILWFKMFRPVKEDSHE